jgi:hypothetical protein
LLIDYQENVLDLVFEQDRRVVELNARTLATAARAFSIPVVLSTVGVEMGVNKPTISSLKAALPDVKDIEDAVADSYRDLHHTAVLRLAHAGAVPRTTSAMISEWFRDWKSPLADPARKIFVPYLEQMAALRRAAEYHEPGR